MTAGRYIAKRPCKNGNLELRLASGHCCCVACRSERTARAQKWQRENPEKQRAMVDKWQAENPSKKKEVAAKARAKRGQANSEYRRQNRSTILARNQKRRASKLSASPGWSVELDDMVFREAAELASKREAITGFKWHVDHMLPLQGRVVCGLHVAENIAVIPAAINIAKGNRLFLTEPGSWLRGQ